ncbi:MAG: Fe-S cluster assembly protein SufD, partial [Ectothiorhodospiraceae bacterium]
ADWLAGLRRRGMEAFEAQGFPTRRAEAWRKTDLSSITAGHFPPMDAPGTVKPELVERLGALGEGHRLVFVDGHLDGALSDLGQLPAGVTVGVLSEYGAKAPERLREVLGARVDIEGHPFAALNTALFRDGVFVHAARGAVLERPLIVVHITTGDADGHAVYPRVAVAAEETAELRVVEHFIGDDSANALVVPVTEVSAAQGAVVDYYRLQEEGEGTAHVAVAQLNLARDANLSAQCLSAGARLTRTDVYADLDGQGAEATLNGLYLTRGRQFADFHTWVNHRAEHGTSRQLFKGVLQGRSETVFDGLVKVFEGAQKTDAQQQNRNLVLDKLALAHSNPRLEIYNDDVKCAHGSTVGELDDDALFYLRSRGIGPQDAQGMLTFAFASETLRGIRLQGVHDHVRRLLFRRLPGDDTVREVV